MIPTRINHHISRCRHVALDTASARSAWLMMMMIWRVVLSSRMLMAGCTKFIIVEFDFRRMRIMTIGATNTVVVHFALNERTVNVIFIPDLAVSVIHRIHYQLSCKVIIKVTAWLETFGHHGAT